MPLVFGEGSTPEACVSDTREALRGAVATLLELGESVSAPAKSGQRTEQLNIRLSTDEKLAIEAAARAKGYAGTSEFVRAAAVNATQPKGARAGSHPAVAKAKALAKRKVPAAGPAKSRTGSR